MDFELEEQYTKETGFNVGKIHDIGCIYHSDDYVTWLETELKKLQVADVSESVCPKFDSCFNKGKNEWCTDSFYKGADCFIGKTVH